MADIRDRKAVPFEEETKESILKEQVDTFEKPAGLDEKVSMAFVLFQIYHSRRLF